MSLHKDVNAWRELNLIVCSSRGVHTSLVDLHTCVCVCVSALSVSSVLLYSSTSVEVNRRVPVLGLKITVGLKFLSLSLSSFLPPSPITSLFTCFGTGCVLSLAPSHPAPSHVPALRDTPNADVI